MKPIKFCVFVYPFDISDIIRLYITHVPCTWILNPDQFHSNHTKSCQNPTIDGFSCVNFGCLNGMDVMCSDPAYVDT